MSLKMELLKLDLHTHCFEAMGFPEPSPASVRKIIEAVKRKGLAGIAVTEHNNMDYGFRMREIVKEHFDNEIIVIPGQEIDLNVKDFKTLDIETVQIVELYPSEKHVFRFLAHPGYPTQKWAEILQYLPKLDGIEIQNGCHKINYGVVERVAFDKGLLLISASDAHKLEDIGSHCTELRMEYMEKHLL